MVDASCAICDGTHIKRLARKGQFGDPAYVVICLDDGFVYLSPRWDADGYSAYYAQEFDTEYRVETGDDLSNPCYDLVVERVSKFIGEAPNRALSIGAGKGSVLRLLETKYSGLSCSAIEPSSECRNHLSEVRGFQVLSDDVEGKWDEKCRGEFDIIILRHVLEHLLDPLATLEKIRLSLTKSGCAYIAVPNMMSPNGSLKNYFFRAPHVSYFSPPTLEVLLGRSGLQILEIKEVESELWCVVGVGEVELENNISQNHAIHQLRVIRRHARKQFFPDFIARARSFIARLIGRE